MAQEGTIMEEISTSVLPHELHRLILSWIPAKSLINSFKFVCKAWCDLIQDPDFINLHLNRISINEEGGRRFNNESLVRKCIGGNPIFQLNLPFNYDKDHPNPIAEAKEMDTDSDLLRLISRLIGSCNGLLCLSSFDDEIIILLNPCTRKFRASPQQLIDSRVIKYISYGFGCYYNSTIAIDEYKVVRLVRHLASTLAIDAQYFQYQIDIYSMSSNSWTVWKRVKDVPKEISLHQSAVCLNGAFHWMGGNLRPYAIWDTIVSFDMRNEVFGNVTLPPIGVTLDDGNAYSREGIVLINVRGNLGNLYFSRSRRMNIELEIWVMKEYGVNDSWTKDFVIRTSDSDAPWELLGYSMRSRSMKCFVTGDHILIEVRFLCAADDFELDNIVKGPSKMRRKAYGRLIFYDMSKKKIDWDFQMADVPYAAMDDQVGYTETLVSLDSSVSPLSNDIKRRDMELLRNLINSTMQHETLFSGRKNR